MTVEKKLPAALRKAIRAAAVADIKKAIQGVPNCRVFASRAVVDGLESFVSVYFNEGDKKRYLNGSEVTGELVVRVASKVSPEKVDDHLDDVSECIEAALLKGEELSLVVRDCYQAGFVYSDLEGTGFSSVELFYQLKYKE